MLLNVQDPHEQSCTIGQGQEPAGQDKTEIPNRKPEGASVTSPITQMAQGLNLNWNCCPDFFNRAASEDREPSRRRGRVEAYHYLPPPPLQNTAGGEWATLGSESWGGVGECRPSRGARSSLCTGRGTEAGGLAGQLDAPTTGAGDGNQ